MKGKDIVKKFCHYQGFRDYGQWVVNEKELAEAIDKYAKQYAKQYYKERTKFEDGDDEPESTYRRSISVVP